MMKEAAVVEDGGRREKIDSGNSRNWLLQDFQEEMQDSSYYFEIITVIYKNPKINHSQKFKSNLGNIEKPHV